MPNVTFTGSDQTPLSAPFAGVTGIGAMNRISNAARSNTGNAGAAIYTGASSTFSSTTLKAGSDGKGGAALIDPATGNGYACTGQYFGALIAIVKLTAGATEFIASTSGTYSGGNAVAIRIVGNDIILSVDGTDVVTAANETSYRSGLVAGMYTFDSTCLIQSFTDGAGGGSTPTITDVDTDESVTSTQTGVVLTVTNAGATQGTSVVEFTQGSTVVAQIVTSWADTSITVSLVFDTGGTHLKFGVATASLTVGGLSGSLPISIVPPSGQLYIDVGTPNTTAAYRITAVGDLASGDQLHVRGVGGGAAPAGLTLLNDGRFYFTAGNTPAAFEVRLWDAATSTWGAWSVQSISVPHAKVYGAFGSGAFGGGAFGAPGFGNATVKATGSGVTDTASAPAGSATGGGQASGAGVTNTDSAPSGSAAGGGQASGAGITNTDSAPSGSATGDALATGSGVTDTTSAPTGSATGGGAPGNASGSGVTNTASAPAGSATGGGQASGAGVTNTDSAPSGSAAGAAQATGAGVTDNTSAPTGVASGGANGAGVTNTATAPSGLALGGAQASGSGATDTSSAPDGNATGAAQAIGTGVTDASSAPSGSAAGAAQATAPGVTDNTSAPTGVASGGANGAGVTNTATAPAGNAVGGAQTTAPGVTDTANAPSGSAAGAAQATAPGVTNTATAPDGTAGGGTAGLASGSGVTNTDSAPSGSATGAAQAIGAGVVNVATAPGAATTVLQTPKYATRQQMISRFGLRELIATTDRDYGITLNETVLNSVLLKADALIDGYLQGRYVLPLTSVPPILVTYACAIARYYLHDTSASDTITRNYKMALKFLQMVGSGRINLGVSSDAQTPATVAPGSSGADRIFTSDTLKDFNS